MACTLLVVASHLFLLLLFFIHECSTCPWSILFECNIEGENVPVPPPFPLNHEFECLQCEPTCNTTNHTILSCRPDVDQVLYISSTNDTIVGCDHPMNLCDAYNAIVFNENLPSLPWVNFTFLGESYTYMGCPPAEDEYSNCTNGNAKINIYGPSKDGHFPELQLIPTSCIQFRMLSPGHNFSIQYNTTDRCQIRGSISADCPQNGKEEPPANAPQIPPENEKYPENHSTIIILSTVIPGLIVVSIILAAIYWRRPKSKSVVSRILSRAISLPERTVMNGVTIFPFAELQQATNNFDASNELGEGGFGIVYHGKLRDGREVAVKRMYERNFRKVEQFNNEIQILTSLKHPNLVTLYGCTSRHSRKLLLVYEYVPNKTLADHLHGDQALSALLSWPKRMIIAIETATALAFLHFKEVIHRDIKTDNILLDNTFRAKVADFGLSRLFPADVSHISTGPQGTPGYIDPEYHQCYHLSDKSDVYSFGVVLVELISSLPAVDLGRHRHEVNLSDYAMNKIQCCAFGELVDAKLGFETDFKVRRMTTLVAELAFRCLQLERDLRPSMEEVLEELKSLESADYEELEADEIGYE